MNRRWLSLAILAALVLSIIGVPSSVSAISVNVPVSGDFTCTAMTVVNGGSLSFNRDNTGSGYESWTVEIIDGAGTVLYTASGVSPVGGIASFCFPGAVYPYTATPQYNPISLVYDSPAGNGLNAQSLVLNSGTCQGLPPHPRSSAAGCTQYVVIPPQAVGGQFVANAPVYYAPESGAQTGVVIQAGNTYLVAGQDATGQYREVLLSCQWVWVPANTVGPNPEAPWNGAPLPTTVVN
jgi:hypothetical protein